MFLIYLEKRKSFVHESSLTGLSLYVYEQV